MRPISTALLVACLVAIAVIGNSQILPKFSGVHTRNSGSSKNDGPNKIPYSDSILTSYGFSRSPSLPVVGSGGKSITFRLSVEPTQPPGTTEAKDVDTSASTQDEASFSREAETDQLLRRLQGALRRGERAAAAGRAVEYRAVLQEASAWASGGMAASRPRNQAVSALLNRLAVALSAQGAHRDALGALSLSLLCLDGAARGRETSEDTLRRARLVSNMGSVAMQDKNFPAALLYYHDVLLKLLGNHDPHDLSAASLAGTTCGRLGSIYLALDDAPQAAAHFRQGAAVFRGIYGPAAAESAADLEAHAASVERAFADSLGRIGDGRGGTPAAGKGSAPADGEGSADGEGAPELGSVLTAAAAERIRHTLVAIVALLVTASGLAALLPALGAGPAGEAVEAAAGGQPSDGSPSTPLLRRALLSPSRSKGTRSRRKPAEAAARTPDPAARGGPLRMERLPAAEEALFSAAELRAMEHLRDGEFLGAEGFLEDTLRARFEPREGAPAQDALGVAECRLRYLLSKAKVGLDKFLEAEQQLYRSIDSYLRLGVLDDVTVAALLDYSLAVIREQLYDDNGEEKFTPDRFVRAHNVFCGLLFSPHSLPGKCLPSQRFQLSGPVDSATVEAFGLLSPAAVLDTSVAARSPMFKSPFRLQREVSPIKAAEEAPVDTLKYSNDNDMLNSLEKLFYQSRRRKDELGTLALMCADFEDLAEEMDRCLQLDDFCIAPAGEAELELELVLHGSAPGVAVDIREEPSAADHTTSRRGAEEPVECPGTDAVATRLGSTTGDDFDGDTFDDLLVGQIEDGDVSRVAHVKLHQSPGSHFGSPAARRELDNSDSASFESPPYLHMRPGMAGSGSDAKENTHNGSIAGTDGYSTDNSNWADIVRGTATARGGKKRKSKHLSSPE